MTYFLTYEGVFSDTYLNRHDAVVAPVRLHPPSNRQSNEINTNASSRSSRTRTRS
jgi:hypothetical protein